MDTVSPKPSGAPQLRAATRGDRPSARWSLTTDVPLREQDLAVPAGHTAQGTPSPGSSVLPQGGHPLESKKPHLGSGGQVLGVSGQWQPLSLPVTPAGGARPLGGCHSGAGGRPAG